MARHLVNVAMCQCRRVTQVLCGQRVTKCVVVEQSPRTDGRCTVDLRRTTHRHRPVQQTMLFRFVTVTDGQTGTYRITIINTALA